MICDDNICKVCGKSPVYEYDPYHVSIWCKECYDKMDADYREAYQHFYHTWKLDENNLDKRFTKFNDS